MPHSLWAIQTSWTLKCINLTKLNIHRACNSWNPLSNIDISASYIPNILLSGVSEKIISSEVFLISLLLSHTFANEHTFDLEVSVLFHIIIMHTPIDAPHSIINVMLLFGDPSLSLLEFYIHLQSCNVYKFVLGIFQCQVWN